MRWLAALVISASMAMAAGEKSGDFDYYVLSLSWSPNWCDLEGRAKNSDQCRPDKGFGWVLHGLWPQYETGWPSYCPTAQRPPSRARTRAMADIMGTAGLAWYQWKKHGTCSGLTADEYFAAARRAFDAVSRPAVFRKLDKPVKLPASIVEEAFLRANPTWDKDMLTITCKAGRIQEARLCLSKDLQPRICGRDVRRDCSMSDALFAPLP